MFADDKSGVKKRRTAIEISAADPDDDEPIGSLLKLKKPRNPKRGEDVSGSGRAKARKFEAWAKNVVLNEKDFGGMDDTLASFRKKLKAPKKDNGSSGTVMGQGSVLNVEEPSAGISDSSTMFGSFDEKSSSVNVFEGQVVGDDRSDATTDKVVDRRSKERPRKSKVASLVKENSNCAQLDHDQVCLRSGFASLHHQEKRQGHCYYSDENLEDSLSAFVRKAQSSLIKRSRTSFNSEQGRDMISDNGLSPRPKGVSDNSERARARKSQSPCVLKQAHVSVQTEKNLQPFFCVTVGNATPNQGATLEDKVSADGLCEVSNCMDGLPLPVDQFEGVSSELSLKDDVLPFSDQKVDRSCNANMEDSDVLIPVKESRDDMICKNVAEIMHCRYGRQGKESQERLAVDPCVQMEENCSATVCRSTLGMKSLKDSLRHCSMGKASGMDHDFVETPSAIFGQMEGDGGGLCGANDSTGYQQPKGVSTASHNAEQSVCSTSLENETSERYFDDNLLGKPHKKASKDSHDKSNQKTFQSKFQSQSSYPWRVKMQDSSKSAFDVAKKEICNCCGDINIFSHTTREGDCVALPAMMSNGENGSVFATDMMQQEKLLRKEDPLSQVSQQIDPDEFVASDLKCGSAFTQTPSSEGATKGISGPSLDHSSLNEESNEVSLQINTADQIEAYTEDMGLGAELECKDGKLSVVQRAARKARKRRHGDMAYEGDIVWDSLIYEQGCLSGDRVRTDQNSNMREKSDSSNMTVEAEDCGVAAVSSGLKACSVSPVEKILFKEILKRRGGLQEYLDCRNRILGLWSRDVSRILLLADCGVSDTPSDGESPRSSLIREIYKFLDHRGYINVGIASKKKKGEPTATHSYKLLKENNIVENSGIPAAESDDGVSFILGQFKVSEACTEEKNGSVPVDEKQTIEPAKGMALVAPRMSESSMNESVECQAGITQENGWALQSQEGNVDTSDFSPPSIVPDQGIIRDRIPKLNDDLHGAQYCSADLVEENHDMQGDSDSKKSIIVIGAGPAGLTAARHLQRQGFFVTVLEGRTRIGGRVYTDHSSLSVPVDLGASIITGVEADVATERRPDPSSLICAQLGLELTVLNSDCPLYDTVTGEKVPSKLDEALEAEYNSLLDDMVLLVAHKGEHAMRMSLEEGLEFALKRRRQSFSGTEYGGTRLNGSVGNCDSSEKFVDSNDCVKSQSEEVLSPLERRVMDWHFANLEYGCAALLQEVSLPYWNQDDVYGGFGGAHCMIKGGYSTVVESLGKGLCIHLNHVVTSVSYSTKDSGMADDQHSRVKVLTSNGSEFSGDAVLITVPLGCLKAESIKFSPPLPHWKHSSIQRLGFGVLNKVVLEFSEVFWDDSVDYFGATAEDTNQRGQCFMFWNVKKTVGAPVLIALVVGKAAIEGQTMTAANHVKHAVMVLRKLFGEALVPDPVASVVTDWGNDPFSFGAYSYVAVGASGEDYDLLARPVEDCVFFAGEATCKEHPDTVGGAMMSGLREAVRIMDILNSGNDYAAEVEAMEAQKHSDGERSEVRDLIKRLDAVELSSVLYKSPIDRAQIMCKEALLQDMFCNAKTTAGRLHLAKELLNLQIDVLKSFAGTKKGLSILNSWILDSMGKDATQLLRHCVRILVRVSTDLLAVRLSGIGKTVREKVCVHTSRDIRAIASQLVSMWIEVFRKEKALNGGRKLLRQAAIADTSKSKPLKDLASGKPPLRMHHSAPVNRESLQYHTPGENRSPSKTNKKVDSKPAKLETMADAKSEIHSSRSLGSAGRMEPEGEVVKNFTMSEEERAAFIAADAARAAAVAAAEAYASSEVKCNTSLQLPKIPSFHKFARREQYAQMDESDARRKWNGSVLGRQDCLSEIDSRNCRVRDWSVDFSAACVNLDSSRVSVDNLSQRSQSNENACQFSLREHSGESTAVDSSIFTKAWIDTAGSVKDYHAIDRWQSQAAAVDSNLRHSTMDIREEEEDSNNISRAPMLKLDRVGKDRPFSHRTSDKELNDSGSRGAERIKQAVVDYVASLLMPLYKAKKIDKEGYKSIMKKSATKVMEQTTDREKTMTVSEFLDFKRKNKIRSFVDKLIERQMSKPVVERC